MFLIQGEKGQNIRVEGLQAPSSEHVQHRLTLLDLNTQEQRRGLKTCHGNVCPFLWLRDEIFAA